MDYGIVIGDFFRFLIYSIFWLVFFVLSLLLFIFLMALGVETINIIFAVGACFSVFFMVFWVFLRKALQD
jgi:hypothetical protein